MRCAEMAHCSLVVILAICRIDIKNVSISKIKSNISMLIALFNTVRYANASITAPAIPRSNNGDFTLSSCLFFACSVSLFVCAPIGAFIIRQKRCSRHLPFLNTFSLCRCCVFSKPILNWDKYSVLRAFFQLNRDQASQIFARWSDGKINGPYSWECFDRSIITSNNHLNYYFA